MNVLVWNCRGVGNSRTVRDLTALVQSYNPKLVFLLETRQSEERMQNLRWRLGLKGCLARSCVGRSDGIALFWDESLVVNLITIADKVINVTVHEDPASAPWRISFFYGELRVEDRHLTWEFMKNVWVRLDRAVANDEWCNLFDQASVEHLVSPCSDHCPILRYEIMWEREQSLGDVIMEAWDSGPAKISLASFASALKGVMQSLHSWSREKFGSVRRKIEELRTRLAELNGMMDDDSRAEARRTAAAMYEMLYREEMMWLQRSRILWLREGYRNTKFFHQKSIWHSRKNRIKRLKAENG
ncbi:hypothetical protein PVAP13_4KG383101 [Panicum virgatum]|uniref:Endonuclease/exonuclease/phosphatase domain-containing protein n=1 Tax=Panicum virgatum TaxID=38727 RepID=A0A8T0TPH2_PANVG|nr:hypothetical protein PVAP13_4KG383101 [Panicum virgatum]